MHPIIEIKLLSKRYKGAETNSLDELNLSIEEGLIFGLLGPNGAGKTTLISILCGLISATSGSFTIAGLTYAKSANKIKRLMGVVPQEYALYPTLTARENLEYFGSMYGLRGRGLKERIEECLEFLGLLKQADKQIIAFSGGMKRRINLIAGVLHKPEVLFLDEPTAGVDVQSRNAIIRFLKQLNVDGTSMIYTSHHLTEAEELCKTVAIMDKGKIFAQGTPADLIASTREARNLEDVFINLTGHNMRDDV